MKEEGRRLRVRERDDRSSNHCDVMLALKVRGATRQGMHEASGIWKHKEMNPPPQPPEEHSPANTEILAQ